MSDEHASSYTAFISHASADAEKANLVCASLEAKGFRCWIAPRDIRAGREYAEEIIYGIQNSRCLILLLSDAANASPFVRREVERAVHHRKPVFPVRMEDVMPSASLELFVSSTHWIDAWAGDLVEKMELLARDINDEKKLERGEVISGRADARKRLPKYLAYAAAILALGLTIHFSVKLALDKDEPIPSQQAPVAQGSTPAQNPEVVTKQELERMFSGMQNVDPLEQYENYAGAKFSDLTRDDFNVYVSADTSYSNTNVKLYAEPERRFKDLLSYADFLVKLDDGPWEDGRLSGGEVRDPDFTAEQLLNARRVEIQFVKGDKVLAGPFTYKLDPEKSQLSALKKPLMGRDNWLRVGESGYMALTLGNAYPVIKAVHYGTSPDTLDQRIDVASASKELETRLEQDRNRSTLSVPLAKVGGPYFVQVEFTDGTRTEVISGSAVRRYYPLNGLYLLPEGEQGPGMVVASNSMGQQTMVFRAVEPLDAVAGYYAIGNDMFARMDGQPKSKLINIPFSFEVPNFNGSLKVKYKLADGTETPVYTYDVDFEAILTEGMKSRVSDTSQYGNVLAAIEVSGYTKDSLAAAGGIPEGSDRMPGTGYFGPGFRWPKDLPVADGESVTVCYFKSGYPNTNVALAAVTSIQVKTDVDEDWVDYPVEGDFTELVLNQGAIPDDQCWYAILPDGATQALSRIVFKDGTVTEPENLPIKPYVTVLGGY